jgi:hypothetical protein
MFKKYDDEVEFDWKPASSILACMKILFPDGPFAIRKEDNQEETVIELCKGCKFFISSFTDYDGSIHGYLMVYSPGRSMRVMGLTDFDERKTVFWNDDRECWEVREGLPELPF